MNSAEGIPDYWQEATQALAARDPVLARLVAAHRPFVLGTRGDAFQTLARAIVGQQISVKAAQSVWQRFVDCVGAMTPASVLRASPEALRGAGLSARKAEYVCDLARHFEVRAIDVAAWPQLGDEAIIEQLVEVRGIGRWTAEMYLIFHLGRPDVLPLLDLGLQRGLSVNYHRGKPVPPTKLRRITQSWAPWRSVGTWYMWRSLEPLGGTTAAEGAEPSP
jgi:DNA-3-methyladenine glycosylase II